MLVAEWMTRSPVTLEPDDPITRAADLMVRRRIRRVPIVDAAGNLLGIVSKADVLAASPPDLNPFSMMAASSEALARPLRQVMSASLISVAGDLPLEAAAQLMVTHKIGVLPVLAADRLVGILTESDVFRAFTSALHGNSPGLRVTLQMSPGEDVVPFLAEQSRKHGLRITSVVTYEKDSSHSAVVQLEGSPPQTFIDELWKTGHRVLSVSRT